MYKRFIVISLIIFLLVNLFQVSPVFSANRAGDKEGPQVYTVQGDHYIDIYVKNKEIYDITITIYFTTLENMATTIFMPYTDTVCGNQTVKAFSLYRVNPQQAWKYEYKYHWTIGSLYAEHDDTYVYSLPYTSGSSYPVNQGFNGSFSHFGDDAYAIDWGMEEGTPVCAARDGVVVAIEEGFSEGRPDPFIQKLWKLCDDKTF